MVDLSRVNASKAITKVNAEEQTKRWEKMQKEGEKRRFEEKMFSNKRKKESIAQSQTQKRVATRDADVYRFKQNKEYSKFQQLIQSNEPKAKSQKSLTEINKQKFLGNLDKAKHKKQQDSSQQTYDNNKLTQQNKTNKHSQHQRLEAKQEFIRNSKNNILEGNKQQRLQQQDQSNIATNKQATKLQYNKENKLLQAQVIKQNKDNLENKLNKQTQQTSNANISKEQASLKAKLSTEQQFADDIHKTQQTKQQVANSLKSSAQSTKKQQLTATIEQRHQDDSRSSLTEKALNKTSQQNKSRTLDISQKQQHIAGINKNQRDNSNIEKNKTTLDFITERQSQENISDQQNTDKIAKNYLSQQQTKASELAKQDTNYKQYSKQDKQETDEKISVEKLYQENKALPLPKNIDPSTTISQALQNPAQRVEVINHIVELIKTYRPFILKEGAFNIIMPGAFWEGTKIVVDIHKKDLEVKISASDQIVTTLEQNKSPLVEALKIADPNLNIKVDIKPTA